MTQAMTVQAQGYPGEWQHHRSHWVPEFLVAPDMAQDHASQRGDSMEPFNRREVSTLLLRSGRNNVVTAASALTVLEIPTCAAL